MHHVKRPLTLILVAISEHSHPKSVSTTVRDREFDAGDLVGAEVAVFANVESAVLVLVLAFAEEGERVDGEGMC